MASDVFHWGHGRRDTTPLTLGNVQETQAVITRVSIEHRHAAHTHFKVQETVTQALVTRVSLECRAQCSQFEMKESPRVAMQRPPGQRTERAIMAHSPHQVIHCKAKCVLYLIHDENAD